MRLGESRFVKHIDFRLVIATLALIGVGLVLLASAPNGRPLLTKQLFVAIIGFGAMLVAIYVDYEFIANAYEVIYALNIMALILTLLIAAQTRGARSWIGLGPFTLQASEFSKLALVATLAVFMSERGGRPQDPLFLVMSFVQVVALPVLLILLQRDTGTALVLVAIWAGIMLAAGSRLDHMGLAMLGVFVAFGLLWKWGRLPAEHVARIRYWLHPGLDPTDEGYHYIVTPATIGSGGVWGTGYGMGPMTQNVRVPEQQTDMIFSVLGEEWGLVGCTVVLALFLFLIWRGLATIEEAKDPLGRYLAAGVVAMLLCHVFVNIGMQTGLMPITGIPLPLMSQGGSSLISCMIGIGLLVNVHMRRRKITF